VKRSAAKLIRVLDAVRVAMVVLEPHAFGDAREHPGARAVLTHVEGDPHRVVAGADLHHESLSGDRTVDRLRVDETALVGLAAMRAQRVEEGVGGRRRDVGGVAARARDAKGRHGEDHELAQLRTPGEGVGRR
jgi:hypothetical protein